MRDIRLLTQMFIPGTLIGPFTQANPGLGGVCTFVGEVRYDQGVEALELTHYEPLTLPGMHELADRAFERFALMGLLMVHRVGQMRPGEPIVCVSAAAHHRREAIDAVDLSSLRVIVSTGEPWTPEALFAFLENPKNALPGTKMAFAGLPKPEDRANVIAYMAANP